MADASPTVSTAQSMRWIFSKLSPYKGKVAGAITALVVSAAAWLVLGQGVRVVVDEGFVGSNGDILFTTMWWVLAIVWTGSVASYVRFYLMIWLSERVSADIRQDVYSHLLLLSPSFFETAKTGEVISRFTSDTTVLQSVVGMGLSMSLRATISLFGALILMLFTSPMLTLYVLVAAPLVLLPIRLLGGRVRKYSKASQDRVADVGAYVDESLHEIQTVQAFNHENADRQRFVDRIEGVMKAASRRIHYRALLIATIMAIGLTSITVVAWLGALQVVEGSVTAGQLTAFMFYAVMAGGSLATLSEVVGEIQKAAGASERLMELLHTQPDITSPQQPKSLPAKVRGQVTLRDIHFRYPSAPSKTVIDAFSLSVSPGERVALVGPSGAGKSTLFHLLLRFYDVDSGAICIDECDIASLSLNELRAQFAIVPQESVIFASSALDNIRYGRPQATEQEVIAAARAARADEFICELPEGYQTHLGERGVRLSGGQKQRIAIARAILADRPILLLDEATSALDAASELQVKTALDSLMQNKTTLIIAHRLSTVVNADRIVVVDNGRIVASGKHHELLNDSALYREYAELQLVS